MNPIKNLFKFVFFLFISACSQNAENNLPNNNQDASNQDWVDEEDCRAMNCYGPTSQETCNAKGPRCCQLWTGDELIVDESKEDPSSTTNPYNACTVGEKYDESYCVNTGYIATPNSLSPNVFYRQTRDGSFEYLKILPFIVELPGSGWTPCIKGQNPAGCRLCDLLAI